MTACNCIGGPNCCRYRREADNLPPLVPIFVNPVDLALIERILGPQRGVVALPSPLKDEA